MRATKVSSGFTLAEVLIALALLGIVAAFAVPKVLQSVQEARKIAIFKETYANLSEIIQAGVLSKEFTTTNFSAVVLSHVNAVQSCPNNATIDGCWTAPADLVGESVQPGYISPNGAVVIGFDNALDYATAAGHGPPSFGYGSGLIIDWNGPEGPNQAGEDWLSIWVCYDPPTGFCNVVAHTSGQTVRAGYFLTPPSAGAANVALFREITQ